MLRKPSFVVTFLSGYLLLFNILLDIKVSPVITTIMLLASPFLVGWMVIVILKFRDRPVRELNANEEWGYGDRDRNSLGIF